MLRTWQGVVRPDREIDIVNRHLYDAYMAGIKPGKHVRLAVAPTESFPSTKTLAYLWLAVVPTLMESYGDSYADIVEYAKRLRELYLWPMFGARKKSFGRLSQNEIGLVIDMITSDAAEHGVVIAPQSETIVGDFERRLRLGPNA